MKLHELCKLFTDGDWIESKDQSAEGIRLVQTGNIGEGKYLEKEGREKYISEKTFSDLKCTEIYPGDVLISRLPDPVGRGCIVPQTDERMITAVDCTICRMDESIINNEYFCYFLQSNYYYQQLDQSVTGTTRKRISRKNLGNVEVMVPHLETQTEIVFKLNSLTRTIRNRQRQLELLDELIKARFVELFGEDKYPRKRLGAVCSKITDGTHKTPNYLDSGIIFVSAKNIINGNLDFSDVKYISEEEYEYIQKRCQTEKGDILLAKSGTLGTPTIVRTDDKLGLFESLAVIKYDREQLLPEFLCEQLKADRVQEQFKTGTKGVAVKHLHLGVIADTEIIVPPMDDQKCFAAFVAQVDKSKLSQMTYVIQAGY